MSMTDVHIRGLIGRAADYCLDLGPHFIITKVGGFGLGYATTTRLEDALGEEVGE